MLRASLDYSPMASLALQQNSVPTVHRLQLTNEGDTALRRLTVELQVAGLSLPWIHQLALLLPGDTYTYSVVDLRLSPEQLVTIVEAVATDLQLTVRDESEVLLQQAYPLEVLAYNQWTGLRGLPELLAAFVLPNHPVVQKVLVRASMFLWEWTGNPVLDGYQSRNLQRARQIAAALYASVQGLGITYVGVPASFEKSGQKVRTPDQIVDDLLGNCLDLSCLLAACLEQAGLHPLLLIVEGHAQVGVWLNEESRGGTMVDDASTLRKSVELGILCLIEATGATRNVPFEEAEKVVLDDTFHFAIDIHASRGMRIRPLPLRLSSEGSVSLVEEEVQRPEPQAPKPLKEGTAEPRRRTRPEDLEAWEKRLERWKNRLLDFTLRNRLLNFREGGKTTLPLLCATGASHELYDGLASGKTFTLRARPRALSSEEPRSLELARQQGQDLVDVELLDNLKRRELNVDLASEELERRLLEIYRCARTSLEETGAKILYVAFGFLRWFETPQSETPRFAPLLLIPVDLQRGTVREAFKLKQSEEDIRPNLTLLQKLEREFRIPTENLYDVPESEDGYDVGAYFTAMQAAVLNVPRWEVVRDMVRVGLFSFSKLLMWMDLQSTAANALVRDLLEGKGQEAQEFPSPAQLDAKKSPQECLCVVDADSSQLSAIYAAEAGLSFVLQGPPGTGKSQTITNLIAQNVARGRSVLFVAEKLAALQVVHSRLSEAGLAPFCLELHSNKASKADVVRQLQESLEAAREAPPRSWEQMAGEVAQLREQLNSYVEVIHRRRPLGRSVFEVTGRLLQLQQAPFIHFPSLGDGSPEHLASCSRLVQALSLCEVGTPSEQIWRDSRLEEWDRSRLIHDVRGLTDCEAVIFPMEDAAARLCQELQIDFPAPDRVTRQESEWLCQLAEALQDCPTPPPALLQEGAWSDLRERVLEWRRWGMRRQQLWGQLDDDYRPQVLELDLPLLLQAHQKWAGILILGWIMLWFSRRRLRKAARKGLRRARQTIALLTQAVEVQQIDEDFTKRESQVQAALGRLWEGPDTDWEVVERHVQWAQGYRQLVGWWGQGGRQQGALIECALQEDRNPRAAIKVFLQAMATLREQEEGLRKRFCLDESWAPSPHQLREWCQDRQKHVPLLREWSHYRRCEKECRALDLDPLVEAHWDGRVHTTELPRALERGYLESWLQRVYAEEKVLRQFQGSEHRHCLAQFQKLDEQLIQLTRRQVRALLASRIPNPNANLSAQSEVAVVKRETVKKRAHMPSRKLFREIQNLLPRLKPVVLMSPLSVAQYLDPALPPFDLVVFDEASQIAPWDAVGVLTRGQQAVVVGDSKQLPPTSFFEKAEQSDDLVDEDEETMDSILDECQGSGLPQLSLLWHYRSRHEHLITFSNRKYYDGRLLTFPANSVGGDQRTFNLGISYRFVQGSFDRGQTRTNREEALAVVEELVARLRDPGQSGRSYGVVTFNLQQQQLIENLLEKQRATYPEIEPFFNATHEPVFVKNLENVQGDERDVILFSVAYGPDKLGRLYMNFGPLNQQGGQRRLNVVVSRAREQMVVFASLRSGDIDLARTAKAGVADFKTFLAFAERGIEALDQELKVDLRRESESPFEDEVGAALKGLGWDLHRQVGCSGYRLDLAVVNPRQPGSYLAAVECDGATYHSAATARDRDRLREMVLRRLGWQVERVWSTDWWHDPKRELARLDERLRALLEGQVQASMPPEIPLEEPVEMLQPVENGPSPYRVAQLPLLPDDPEKILRQGAKVQELLALLLEVEAPITLARAVSRLAACWGMKRVGSRTKRYLELQAQQCRQCQLIDEVLWTSPPETYREVRLLDPLELPLAEVANGMERVLRDGVALHESDLIRASARFFGLSRAGKNVESRLLLALGRLESEGRAVREEEVVRLPR